MNNKKRNLKDNISKRDLVLSVIVISFILITAILSYFFGEYGILRYIAGGERLFTFWIIVGIVILGLEGIIRLKKKIKNGSTNEK